MAAPKCFRTNFLLAFDVFPIPRLPFERCLCLVSNQSVTVDNTKQLRSEPKSLILYIFLPLFQLKPVASFSPLPTVSTATCPVTIPRPRSLLSSPFVLSSGPRRTQLLAITPCWVAKAVRNFALWQPLRVPGTVSPPPQRPALLTAYVAPVNRVQSSENLDKPNHTAASCLEAGNASFNCGQQLRSL
jgi:hypothetical protein